MYDELVKYPTAKLAKEKGFDEVCYYLCEPNGSPNHCYENGLFHRNSKINVPYSEYLVSVPTQSLLQKWLREIHNINITPPMFFSGRGYACTIISDVDTVFYETYEDALEDELYKNLDKLLY